MAMLKDCGHTAIVTKKPAVTAKLTYESRFLFLFL